jgi:hypothetical protein
MEGFFRISPLVAGKRANRLVAPQLLKGRFEARSTNQIHPMQDSKLVAVLDGEKTESNNSP